MKTNKHAYHIYTIVLRVIILINHIKKHIIELYNKCINKKGEYINQHIINDLTNIIIEYDYDTINKTESEKNIQSIHQLIIKCHQYLMNYTFHNLNEFNNNINILCDLL